ncbi:hypothetical protein MOQ_008201, partial [Trypanosoma cruzi marinkellei]
MCFNRLTLHVSAHRLYFMGSSACWCSPQPFHRRVSAARRAQSLVCVCGRGSERSTQTRRESRLSIGGVSAAKEKIIRGGRNAHKTDPEGCANARNKQAKQKEKHGGRVWLCVCGAAGVCPPSPQIKQNKRERNVCSAPPALVARPHVTAPSARGASRPLLMRAAGEAHRAVVMSVAVGVRVEQLGGKHTAPLAGRVQQETIKERGKSRKEKR